MLRSLTLALVAAICRPTALAGCESSIAGHLEIIPLTSSVFHNQRNLRIWLPPGYEDPGNAGKKYKVLYLLDGQNLFDACTAFESSEMRADETLTRLISEGKLEPLIAVGVDNGSKGDGKGGDGDGGVQRAREFPPYGDPGNPAIKNPLGAQFPRFLETDVMPLVKSRYRILEGPENTAIHGASYGGVAAVYALINRPRLFGSGIIESPAVQTGYGRLLRDTSGMLHGPARVALGVGTAEINGLGSSLANLLLVRAVRSLADHFREAGGNGTSVRLTIKEGAPHNTRAFGERFADALLFLYAAPGR